MKLSSFQFVVWALPASLLFVLSTADSEPVTEDSQTNDFTSIRRTEIRSQSGDIN